MHIVSAWASDQGISLGQVATEEKSNEITAIPQLLNIIDVEDAIVTIDAAGCQNFDYFSANCSFAWHFDIKAQYCWAHLIRDIRFLLKHPDKKARAWAEQLLDRSRRLFTAWHRREEMTDEGFRRSMLTHRDRFLERVRNPPSTREATNLAARFAIVEYSTDRSPQLQTYDLSQDYFRFMFARRDRADEQSQRTTNSPLRDRPPDHARHPWRNRPTLPRAHVDCNRHMPCGQKTQPNRNDFSFHRLRVG